MLWFKCDEIIPGVSIAVVYVFLLVCGVFLYMEHTAEDDVHRNCRIAHDALRNMEKFRATKSSAFIVGHTGEVGRALVTLFNETKLFKRVVLIGRRTIDLGEIGPEFDQVVVDFEKLDDSADIFQGISYGFCSLGTSHGIRKHAEFVRVDHDYVLKTAELAKAGGCKHYSVISTYGSDKNSSFFYRRIKGQMEDTLKVIHFHRLSIFRPGVLLCDREHPRPGETVLNAILKPISFLFPTAVTVPVEVIARAMLNNVIATSERTFDVFENKAIHSVAGVLEKQCSSAKFLDEESPADENDL